MLAATRSADAQAPGSFSVAWNAPFGAPAASPTVDFDCTHSHLTGIETYDPKVKRVYIP